MIITMVGLQHSILLINNPHKKQKVVITVKKCAVIRQKAALPS